MPSPPSDYAEAIADRALNPTAHNTAEPADLCKLRSLALLAQVRVPRVSTPSSRRGYSEYPDVSTPSS